jgi:hypothetical protein
LDHFGIVTQGDALGLLGSHRWCWEEIGGFFGSRCWCWEKIGGFFHDLALGGEAAYFFLVPGQGEALVKGGGDLALEFADSPLVGGGFDLVEAALGGVGQREQFDVVGPAEGERVHQVPQLSLRQGQAAGGGFVRQRRTDWLVFVGVPHRFVRQCRTNPKMTVKRAIQLEASRRCAFDFQWLEPIRQIVEQAGTILRAVCAVLFELRDVLADEPIADDKRSVHRTSRPSVDRLMGFLAKGDELVEVHAFTPILSRCAATLAASCSTSSTICGSGAA